MGLIDDCKLFYGTKNLYELLKIKKEANDTVIKQAYKKLSLTVHPDRVSNDNKDTATKKFQILSKVTQILLDKDSRSIYDSEGVVDDEFASNKDSLRDWSQYWKTMFNMTIEDLKIFEETYRHSEEEANDLKAVYLECQGDMNKIFEMQICSQIEDEERFRKILHDGIDKDEIPGFDAFVNESKSEQRKRKRFYEREKKEAEAELKRRNLDNLNNESDLEKLIMSRQDNRKKQMDSFLSDLEAKYSKPKKKSSTKRRKTKA